MTTVSANDKALIVAYKLKGTFYNTGSDAAGNSNPFEERVVAPGTSFDVPGELIHVRELGESAPAGGKPGENRGRNTEGASE